MKLITFLSYGERVYSIQTLISALTFYYHHREAIINGEYKFVFYTNEPELFKVIEKFSIIKFMDAEKIKHWYLYDLQTHRAKILMIKEIMNELQEDVLYLDSDTFFLTKADTLLNRISSEVSLMHLNETLQKNKREGKWKLIFRRFKPKQYIIDKKNLKVILTTDMWNAGVIGLSYKNKDLLQHVIAFNDVLSFHKQDREQLSFSFVLNEYTNVEASEEYIYHYYPERHNDVEKIDRWALVLYNEFDLNSTDSAAELAYRSCLNLFLNKS